MTTVVGVKFKKTNKIYYFSPGDIPCAVGDAVVVETSRGTEIGDVVMASMELDDDKVVAPLKSVVRKVNERDLQMASRNKTQEADAFKVFEQMIAEYKLDMKPVDVEYAFDASKITFFFTADGRVDFRELVKGLAHHFRSRIELRQIGVRDEAKMLGGLGKCGCPICCKRFLPAFTPVSIKMAKEQNISLNPNKISGLCGRLMCCLNYEQSYYEQMRRQMPRMGAAVKTAQGHGIVMENNYLTGLVKVKVERDDGAIEVVDVSYESVTQEHGKQAFKHLNENDIPVQPWTIDEEPATETAEAAPKSENNAEAPKKRRDHHRRRNGPPKGQAQPTNGRQGQ